MNIILNLCVGLFCALIGVWIGYRLAKSDKTKENKQRRIENVVTAYFKTPRMSRKADLIEFIRAGAAELESDSQVLAAAESIKNRGVGSPIPTRIQERLAKQSILDFLKLCSENGRPTMTDLINDRKINEFLEKYQARKGV